MRWYLIGSIVSDSRILLLLVVLVFFIIVAGVIILFEIKLKKRTKKKFTSEVEDTRLTILKSELKKATHLSQKLSVIDKQAKGLFKERFHLSHKKSYSELIETFNQKQKYNYSSFCEKMFEAYYSDEGVTEEKIRTLIVLLTRLIREKGSYLDPEKYSLENLYPSGKEEPVHKVTRLQQSKLERQRISQLDRRKEQFSKKQQALMEKQMFLTAKQKEIVKKEKKMRKQEKLSEKILKQVEEKLKQQEVKLKEQTELQHRIATGLKKEEAQKNKIEVAIREKKLLEKRLRVEEAEKYWRDTIEVNAPKGKEWLEARKKRNKR